MAIGGLPYYSQLNTMFTTTLAKITFTQTDDSTDCKLTRRGDIADSASLSIASLQVTCESSALEKLSMVGDVIVDERGDEKEGMVVSRLHAEGQGNSCGLARLLSCSARNLSSSPCSN
jgi:hypothetical protein